METITPASRAQRIVRTERCVECRGVATTTLDFDVFGQLEQLAVCAGCLPLVERKVAEDLEATGKVGVRNTFGYGGSGRD